MHINYIDFMYGMTLFSHLLDVPVAELCGDLNPLCVLVHSEVQVGATALHG